ncbi:hypothetical protein HK102_010412 [Quaeritorhiza haematococci]|nr:hypothetical protein HK102_010412 [Quaeritorhiza haematococci]
MPLEWSSVSAVPAGFTNANPFIPTIPPATVNNHARLERRTFFPSPPKEMPRLFRTGNTRSWYGNMIQRLVTRYYKGYTEKEILDELLWVYNTGVNRQALAYRDLFLLDRKAKAIQQQYRGDPIELFHVVDELADSTDAEDDEELPDDFWPPAPKEPEQMPAIFATGNSRSWFGNMMQRLANAAAADVNAVEDQVIGELMWLHGHSKVEAYQTFWELKLKLHVLQYMFFMSPQGLSMALDLAARVNLEPSETHETRLVSSIHRRRSTNANSHPSHILNDPAAATAIHNNNKHVHIGKRSLCLLLAPAPTEKPFLFWSGGLLNWYGNMMERLATGTEDAENEVLRELLWLHKARFPRDPEFGRAYRDFFLLQRKVREMREKHGSEFERALQQMADGTNNDQTQIPDDFWPVLPKRSTQPPALFRTGNPQTWYANMMKRLASAGEADVIAVEDEVIGELMWTHMSRVEVVFPSFSELKLRLKVLASIFDDDPQLEGFWQTLHLAAQVDL